MTRGELLQSKQELEQADLRRFPKYPEYDESGIHWFGEKPSHWKIRRLKHVSSAKFSNIDKHSIEGEEPVRLCNYTDVYYNDYIHETIDFMEATATEQEIKKFKIKKDDVIITKDSEDWDDIAIPAYVITDFEDVLCGYHLALMRANKKEMFGKYLFRSFQARGINDQFRVASNGITRYGLGKYGLDNGFFLVPPIPEQKAIASFLDRETERIDRLIEKKRRLIELLKEKRTALISHAVTKGLNPDAPMKPSGIDWLGDVPEHWEVKSIRRISNRVQTGSTPPTNEERFYESGTVPWYGPSSINHKLSINNPSKLLNESSIVENKARLFNKNSIMIVTIGATLGKVAFVDHESSCNQQMTVLEIDYNKQILPKYIAYQLKMLENTLRAIAPYATLPIMDQEEIKRLKIVHPKIIEQERILNYIEAAEEKIFILIYKNEEVIKKLLEYRSALISAAVTGKIDVRGEINE